MASVEGMLVLGRTIAARDIEGALYVSVDSLCETLEIGVAREIRRIVTDLALAPQVRYLPFPSAAGEEIRLTLPAHAFLAWVARLEAKRVKNPLLKARLLSVQQSLCRPAMTVSPTPSPSFSISIEAPPPGP